MSDLISTNTGLGVDISTDYVLSLLPSGVDKNLVAIQHLFGDIAGKKVRSIVGDEAVDLFQEKFEKIPPGIRTWLNLFGAKYLFKGVDKLVATENAATLKPNVFSGIDEFSGKISTNEVKLSSKVETKHFVGDKINLGDGQKVHANIASLSEPVSINKLPKELAETFAGGRYGSYVLDKDIILYRAGSSVKQYGQYFSKDKPTSVVQVRIDKAIPTEWKGGEKSIIDTVYTFKVPAGTVVHAGKISTQGKNFVGGTQQVIVEESFWNNLQLIKKEPLE